MRYVAVLIGMIAVLAFIGCGDRDPVSSVSQEGINAPAGKLVTSATKAGGYRGEWELRMVYQDMIDALNAHDLDRWLSYWTDDLIWNNTALPPVLNDKTALSVFMSDFLRGFPDFHASPQRILSSGNFLVVESIYTGTLQEDWLGIPAAGQIVQGVPILEVWEFEGDSVMRKAVHADTPRHKWQEDIQND